MKDNATRVPVVIAARWGRALQLYQPRQEIDLNDYYDLQGRVATELQFWSFYLVLGGAVVGAVVLRRRGTLLFPQLAVPAMCLFAIATTFAQWRYRAATEPALVLLAAVAFVALINHLQRRRRAAHAEAPAPASALSKTADAVSRT
jgi:hypothetical protein